MSETKTLVVNLFGGPGTDKSHTAARLYGNCRRYEAELIREFAKDCVWMHRTTEFQSQMTICGEQINRTNAVDGQVDVLFTDSPIFLAAAYTDDPALQQAIKNEHEKYWNLNIFLIREKPYNPNGRFQTEKEADKIAIKVKRMLYDFRIPYITLDADGTQDLKIMTYVDAYLKGRK